MYPCTAYMDTYIHGMCLENIFWDLHVTVRDLGSWVKLARYDWKEKEKEILQFMKKKTITTKIVVIL